MNNSITILRLIIKPLCLKKNVYCIQKISLSLILIWIKTKSSQENDIPEVHLEFSRTSSMKLFCESSLRLNAFIYFRQKISIEDVRKGSKSATVIYQ